MKIENAAHFAESVTHVLATMVGTEVTCASPKVFPEGSPTSDVTGIVTFAGDLVGAMILTFPEDVIKKLVYRFAMLEADIRDPDFLDAVGELSNMVAGHAKSKFEGYTAMISIPTVVCGDRHHVNRQKTAPWLIIPSSCDDGKFVVGVSLIEKGEA